MSNSKKHQSPLKTKNRLFSWFFYGLALLPLFTLTASSTESPPLFERGQMHFKSLTSRKDIPSGIITLAQDHQGFIWLGTQQGLVRYDGHQFVHFRYDVQDVTSLSDDFVISLWAAADGKLWIATGGGGVSVYDPQINQFARIEHDPENAASLSASRALAITGDENGNVFVGTRLGLDRIDVKTGDVTRLDPSEGCPQATVVNNFRELLIPEPGVLLAGSTAGLCRIELPADGDYSKALVAVDVPGMERVHILRLFRASNGDIWIGTPGQGAYWIDRASGRVQRLQHDPDNPQTLGNNSVVAIAQYDGEIWLGTSAAGITRVDPESGAIKGHIRHQASIGVSIDSNVVSALLVDRSGLLWIGHWDGEFNMFGHTGRFTRSLRHLPNDPSSLSESGRAFMLELSDGKSLVGLTQNGIDIVDPVKGRVGGFRPNPDDPDAFAGAYMLSMIEHSNGDLWVADRNAGVYRYDAKRDVFEHALWNEGENDQARSFQAIFENVDGRIWVATNRGALLLDHETYSVVPLQDFEGPESVKKSGGRFGYTKDGRVWWVTLHGLSLIDTEAQSFRLLTLENVTGESMDKVGMRSVYISQSDDVLIATNEGLYRLVSLDGDIATVQSIDTEVGRKKAEMGHPGEDASGRLWHSKGMIDPQSDTFWQAPADDVWGAGLLYEPILRSDGLMAFGASQGVFLVDPARWQPWRFQPRIIVSSLDIDGEEVSKGAPETLVLPPETKSFSVEFTTNDFWDPEKAQFAYRLEGFDDDWIETDANDRRATYTNLPPGEYQLHIKGTNSEGAWSPEQTSLRITQVAAWYETYAFRGVVVFVFWLLLVGVYKWRVYALNQQKQALNTLVKERTGELEAALSKVERISLLDPLTGTNNRLYMEKMLGREIARMQRQNQDSTGSSLLSFLLVDLDRFKSVNDNYGHDVGDAVLTQLGEVLRQASRENDLIIRFGGEEFLIVSEIKAPEDLDFLAERVCRDIENHTFESGTLTLNCTGSIGAACYDFTEAVEPKAVERLLTKLADLLLYVVKEDGRNGWAVAEVHKPATLIALQERGELDLTSATEHGAVTIRTSA